MMKVSKICANATYHKVMKDLHNYGFIVYKPSYNPFRGSEVELVQFDDEQVQIVNSNHTRRGKRNEQVLNSYHTKIETSIEPINEPYINNTNIINSKLAYEQSHKNTCSDFDRLKFQEADIPTTINEQPTTKRNQTGGRAAAVHLPTSVNEVHAFFEEEKSTKHEAEKFYNYFQSNGWKVGGRSPMKDWRAAARNWILNSSKFNSGRQSGTKLHATTEKNYGEPL